MTLISVVIPTHRRLALLARCLDALDAQSLEAADFEIIVADDANDPATRDLVRRYRARIRSPLRYLAVDGPRHGPAAARNHGWRAARSPIIAFTDDDTIPARDWLRGAIEGFDNARLQGAWGTVRVPLRPRPTDYERDAAGLERAGFVTANCFVRRTALEAIGGFDEAFGAAWREDSDLYFRLLDRGLLVAHLPDAVVTHPVRPAPWGISVSQQRKCEYDALLYRKHPARYSAAVRPGRPWLYYPIVGALLVMVVGALLRRPRIAEAGAVLWLILTIGFAVRRLRGASLAPSHVAEMLVTSAVIPALSVYHRTRGAMKHRVFFW
jgi:GT2 family glycosyltransferase